MEWKRGHYLIFHSNSVKIFVSDNDIRKMMYLTIHESEVFQHQICSAGNWGTTAPRRLALARHLDAAQTPVLRKMAFFWRNWYNVIYLFTYKIYNVLNPHLITIILYFNFYNPFFSKGVARKWPNHCRQWTNGE